MKNWLSKILGGQKRTAGQAPDVEMTQLAATYAPQDPQALQAAEEQVAEQWKVGDVILGLYQVKQIHEGGGMGRLYQVHHRGWDLDLAVKSPRANYFQTEAQKENFTRECETWINLGLHPHIVSCHYVRTLGGIPRVFAEYVEGGTLKEWIDSRKLYKGGPEAALKRILDIAIQMSWGLHYAHEKGVIHQDVKPGNVLILSDGTVKIADFGLARAMATAGDTPADDKQQSILVSNAGMTPAYCSPEQANRQPLSRKTDLWSWAVGVLEMFVGEVCWQSGTAAPEVLKRLNEIRVEGVSPPEMPEALNNLLQVCFESDAAKRPENATEVSQQLAKIYENTFMEIYIRQEPLAIRLLADGLNNRALSLLDLGKDEEAVKVFNEALQVEPSHPECIFNRGLLLWRRGKITDETLLTALEEAANDPHRMVRASFLIGQVHLERGDGEAALKAFEAALPGGRPSFEIKCGLQRAKALVQAAAGARALEGHTANVVSLRFSADNRQAVSVTAAKGEKTIRVWKVPSGRCIRVIEGNWRSIALSNDGHRAISKSEDFHHPIRLWNVTGGRCVGAYEGDWSVDALTNAGDKAVSINFDDMKVWELGTGRILQRLTGHADFVTCVVLSPDGKWALSGSEDKNLMFWELATGRCHQTFKGHTHAIDAVALSADCRWAISIAGCGKLPEESTIRLWDVSAGQCVRIFNGHSGSVYAVAMSSDGCWALSGAADDTLRLWEVSTGCCKRTLTGIWGSGTVALSNDGRYAIAAHGHGKLQLRKLPRGSCSPWIVVRPTESFQQGELERQFQDKLQRCSAYLLLQRWQEAEKTAREALSCKGYSQSPVALDGLVQANIHGIRKKLRNGFCSKIFVGHTAEVTSAAFCSDGHWAISGSEDKTIRLWDSTTGRCLRIIEGHRDKVRSVSTSGDGCLAVSGSDDKTLRLWDLCSGRCLRVFNDYQMAGSCSVKISSCGDIVISADAEYVTVWEVATGRSILMYKLHAQFSQYGISNQLAMSADHRWVLCGSNCEYDLRLWDISHGRFWKLEDRSAQSAGGVSSTVGSLAISSDNRWALSTGAEGVRLWDVVTSRCVRRFGEGGTAACFSADNKWVLSEHGKNLCLWDVANGHCVRTFKGHTRPVHSVCMSSDGRWALSASEDKTLRLWELDWDCDFPETANWDAGASPYLTNFLTLHTPAAKQLPNDRSPTEKEAFAALTRRGHPVWDDQDFKRLLYTLACAGYGWLRPDGVRRKLEEMAADWQGPPPLPWEKNS